MKDHEGNEITHTASKYIIRHARRHCTETFEFDDDASASEFLRERVRAYPGEFIDAYQHIGAQRYTPSPGAQP